MKSIANVAAEVLSGRIAMARGDHAAAIAAYQRAVVAEDALDYDEPADWYHPTREMLGAVLLRDRRYSDAEKVFREDLQHNLNNPRSLWGLSRSLRAQKKDAAAATLQFQQLWHGGTLTIEDL